VCSLSEEIKAYELYMRLTPAEEKAAQSVISDITSITRDHLGDTPLVLLGSRSTGLATPLSDFDLTFPAMPSMDVSAESILIGDRQKLKSQALSSLRKIQQSLHRSVRLKGTEVVTARVPILETQHQATGLRIQIQTMAPYQPAQEYTVAYLNEMPSIRPLYIILRYFLEIRDLTTVYEGGLGSYSLLMMIVTALKHSSGTFATDDLGGQLLYILHFYGSADLYRFGFSANPPRMFDKISKGCSMAERLNRSKDPQLRGIDEIVRNQNSRKPYLLSLQDPANDSNDLGKNAYAIKHIQATFIKARESIVNSLQRRGDFAKAETWSCLDYLVRADYTAFEAKRSRVERSTNRQMPRDRDYSQYRVQEDFLRRVEFRDEEGMKSADGGKTYRKVDHIEAKSTHSEPLSQPRITTHYLTCSFSKHRVR